MTIYEHGRKARSEGCFRVLADPESAEELAEFLRGWDDQDRELKQPAPRTPDNS